jgi:hypothetical protein
MDISLVVKGDLFPKIDHPVLEIYELPEQRLVYPGIGVPVLVLPSWDGMQVQHDVQILRCTTLDDSIEDAKSFRFDDTGV